MVKIILLLTLSLSFAVLPANAQSWTTQDSTKTDGAQRLERYELVIGSALVFSLEDYVGYNLVKRNNSAPISYRILEGTIQTAISYFLYKTCGLSSAISFNLMWWTWNDDLAYYGWANVINPSGAWENRSNYGLRDPEPYWAWWTPIGLLRPKNSLIARSALFAQAAVGFSVSIGILW